MKGVLLKKVLRDIRGHIGAYLACAMLMAIGVMFYASMTQVADNLPVSQHAFYGEYRFADAFATVHGMPAARLSRLAALEGVTAVSGRLTTSARVVREGDDSNVELKLISYDPAERGRLNDVRITEGAPLGAGQQALLLSENFYKANGYAPGDIVDLAFRGQKVSFAVAGSVQTPEYVYLTPEGSIMPDDKSYGVAYVPLDILEAQLGRRGEVNDVAFLLEGGEAAYGGMERALKDALAPGGLTRLYPREDQASHSMLELELVGIQSMVSVVPLIFLLLGALVMSVIVKRMVEQQHMQIGLMKAFGYSQRDVMLHYALYGVFIGLLASLIGGLLGAVVAGYMADLFSVYFVMPGISGAFSPGNVFQLSVLALLFGAGASLYGARGVLRLGAADAMRPAAPPSGKPILLERLRRFWGWLGSLSRLSLRNLFRARSRTAVTWLGLAVCYALTTAVFAFSPMVDFMMDENFRDVQRYDIKMTTMQMVHARPLENSLTRMQGVRRAEAVAELPLTLRAGAVSKDATLLAIPADAALYRLYDENNRPLPLPDTGVVLTARLAEELGVGLGDTLLLDIPYPEKKLHVQVSALCEQYTSNYVVMNREALASALRMGGEISTGAMLTLEDSIAAASRARLLELLNEAQNVSSVMDVLQMQQSMNELIQTSMTMLYAMAVMAVFAGFAIVYNASVVILSERTRELASMRVLGFTLWETVWVVALEQLILLLAGVLLGMPLAGATMEALAQAVATDAFAMPTNVPLGSHIGSILCMGGAWLAAMLISARKVRRASMADVLKERD